MDMQRDRVRIRTQRKAPVMVASAQIAALYAGSTVLTPLYHLYREAFGFSQLTLTLIYSAYVLGNLIAVLLLGRLSDQIGRRAVNMAALGIGAVATLLFLLATSTAWLFAGRITSGLGIGLGASATSAWLAELVPDKRRATRWTTEGNFIGLAAGALAAGLLATYAPWPLRLTFVVYLAVLCAMVPVLARTRETLSHPLRSVRELALRPRLGVPRQLLASFLPPAAIGFAAFATIGYYAALLPSMMARALHRPSPAAGAAVVALLLLVGTAAGVACRGLARRTAMLTGSALLLPGLALLPCAEGLGSFPLLILGTVLTGIATMLGYRGSLEVVNEIAPPARRAELLSSYILFMYAGNSVPIIGIGLLSSVTSSLTADVSFAVVVALFVVLALIVSARRG